MCILSKYIIYIDFKNNEYYMFTSTLAATSGHMSAVESDSFTMHLLSTIIDLI